MLGEERHEIDFRLERPTKVVVACNGEESISYRARNEEFHRTGTVSIRKKSWIISLAQMLAQIAFYALFPAK